MVLTSNKLRHYKRFLKEKHTQLENVYYAAIDELTQKLGDLELPGIVVPDFVLTEFSFIAQWEDGHISSTEVYEIFKKMEGQGGYRTAARSKVIKPLQAYLKDNDVFSGFIKYTLTELETNAVPVMEKYIELMGKAFKHMAEIDARQIKVTWIEQTFDKGEVWCISEEMSLNQTIRQINAYVARVSDATYFVKDSVVVFDQIHSMDERTINYIFGPRTYIELLKALYEIKSELTGEAEEKYLKEIIMDHVG